MSFVWITRKQQLAIEAAERDAAMAVADFIRRISPTAADSKAESKQKRLKFTAASSPTCFPPLPKTMAEILEAQAKLNVLRPGRNPLRPAPHKQAICQDV